jgi:hypothetical protein
VLRVLPDYALRPGTVITHSPWTGRGPVSLPVTFTPSSATADAEVASFELRSLQLDSPRDDEVLVSVKATGICHTDLAT